MLQVKKLTFSYNDTPVLKDLSFQVKPGEHLSIIGESGSGKSTLLKVLYGEYDSLKGTIFWKEEEILGPKHNLVIGYSFMKYVAQEFDLMPFISVEENIGKFLSNFYPEEKQKRIAELIKVVELENVAKTKVKLLSGGQKQRVALARALAKQPEIILLDEPFSHIDNFKKQSLRRSVFKYLKEKNIACIVATHDKEDVLGYADKMIVLNNHEIAVNNTPENLYKSPKTPLIASFFGEFNVINNEIIYAHQLQIVERSDLKVIVKKCYFKGSYYLIEAILNEKTLLFESKNLLSIGAEMYLEISE
ncbi:ABC transporter ATP-binding protein [Lacinutrix sp. C3R15]|uniref:ABC transporter ATP-binding protein n=1 Tax=Flavobacteriaceae TaxID=49546 RepID=UPI001C080930|nr:MULTISPECIES: ABC transporter ATP-binding protein [Flavobacteriaceae]MBU2937975.1 ABC transporter ATP-binding protein [Lacinutrix sp. C3R15]MDO6621289.1 ABC transporter ATP-binding protein [Oceanihabitans sp. 1_MG-2023]